MNQDHANRGRYKKQQDDTEPITCSALQLSDWLNRAAMSLADLSKETGIPLRELVTMHSRSLLKEEHNLPVYEYVVLIIDLFLSKGVIWFKEEIELYLIPFRSVKPEKKTALVEKSHLPLNQDNSNAYNAIALYFLSKLIELYKQLASNENSTGRRVPIKEQIKKLLKKRERFFAPYGNIF